MEKKSCKNCAYAAARTDLTDKARFSWCKYICTYPDNKEGRHIIYKYENDICDNYLPTDKPDED